MLLNTNETYQSLQTFSTLDEMNQTVKYYKQQFKNELTKSTYAVLDFLSTWACKYIGVCYLSKSKIGDELGITRRTVIRACEQLEDLGVIVQHSTKRATGDRRRSTNAIVLQPCHNQMSQQDTPQNTQNINNTVVTEAPAQESNEKVIKDALLSKIPQPLRVLGYFFDVDEVYKHTGTIYKAKSAIDKSITIEDHAHEFEMTIKQVIQSFKLGKIRSFDGVLFASIKALCKGIWLRDSFSRLLG